MRILFGLVAGLLVVTAVACNGGGDGSGDSKDDAGARANEIVLTYFQVFAGTKPPQALLDLFAPECRQGVNSSEIAALVELLQAFLPELADADIEAVDLGDLDIDETSEGFQVTPEDPNGMRFRVNGRFVNAQEYLTGLLGDDAGTFTSVPGGESLTLVRRDGRLYIGDCADLQDVTG